MRRQYFVFRLMGIFFWGGLMILPLSWAISAFIIEEYDFFMAMQDICPTLISFWIIGFYRDSIECENLDIYQSFGKKKNCFLLGEPIVFILTYWIIMMVAMQIMKMSPLFNFSFNLVLMLSLQMISVALLTTILMKLTKNTFWSIVGIIIYLFAFLHMQMTIGPIMLYMHRPYHFGPYLAKICVNHLIFIIAMLALIYYLFQKKQ